MILVLNIMKDEKLSASFNKAVLRPIEKSGQTAEFYRVTGSEPLPDPAGYSHVIFSGSEASAINDEPWDKPLQAVIERCVVLKKPLLAICYGHQFLARTLAGREHVARAVTPEFGWTAIKLQENPLFKGMPLDHFSMVCHYDLVRHLTPDFKPIAASGLCEIHGFQYRDLPIWGVQFHPELNEEESREVFAALKEEEPLFPSLFNDSVLPQVRTDMNERIFLNFLCF